LRRALPEIRAAGVDLVVVGSGRPEHARDFLEKVGLDAPVFCDRSLDAYRLARLHRGLGRVFSLRAGLNAVRALAGGFMPSRTQGDAAQQGGIVLVTPAKRVVYHHASEVAGEPLPLEAILAAVRAAGASARE
jgi:hypothetical protein